jgi:bifunctional ADP-heptose synthase (sugar kinase/adenylyltransferase)
VVSISNPKPRNLSYFGGFDAVTLNQFEAAAGSGIDIHSAEDAERAGRKLLHSIGCRCLVVTRGSQGPSVFEAGGGVHRIPAVESEVADAAGAGDTFVSALALALSTGLEPVQAGFIANCAGGVVVRKVGVATTSVEEIGAFLNGHQLQS